MPTSNQAPAKSRKTARRIQELTGRDLSRLDDQVDFFLALRIR